MPLRTLIFLRPSKKCYCFLYDYMRTLALFEIKLNLIELINFEIPVIINKNQTFQKNDVKAFMKEDYVFEKQKL